MVSQSNGQQHLRYAHDYQNRMRKCFLASDRPNERGCCVPDGNRTGPPSGQMRRTLCCFDYGDINPGLQDWQRQSGNQEIATGGGPVNPIAGDQSKPVPLVPDWLTSQGPFWAFRSGV
jgi:hypothetical protein